MSALLLQEGKRDSFFRISNAAVINILATVLTIFYPCLIFSSLNFEQE